MYLHVPRVEAAIARVKIDRISSSSIKTIPYTPNTQQIFWYSGILFYLFRSATIAAGQRFFTKIRHRRAHQSKHTATHRTTFGALPADPVARHP
jgi:hypothetical protein